jgi:hypothetical protein
VPPEGVILFATYANWQSYPSPVDGPGYFSAAMAVNEINANLGVAQGGAQPQHIGVIVCDSLTDPMLSAPHLIKDLGVRAIYGELTSSQVQELTALPGAANVFFLSLLSDNQSLVSLKQSNLWFLTPDLVTLAPAFGQALSVLETTLQARRAPGIPLKVLLVERENDGENQAFGSAVESDLFFNNAPASLQDVALGPDGGDGDFKTVLISPAAAISQSTMQDIYSFHADVIVDIAGNEFSYAPSTSPINTENGFLPQYEALGRTDTTDSGTTQPYYLGSPLMRNDNGLLEVVADYNAGGFIPLQYRIFGVDFLGSSSLYSAYVGRLRTFSIMADSTRGLDGFNYQYDATYALAYAVMGAPGGVPLAASAYGKGMERIVASEAPQVSFAAPSPGPFELAQSTLSAPDASVQFVGTSGVYSLEPTTHVRVSNGASLFCITKQSNGSFEMNFDALTFNEDGGLSNTLTSCNDTP